MFSEPVIGNRFFGREEVLELLNRRVSALKDGYRQNVALTGQSLSGKSSIIHHFLHTLHEEDFIPVYVEVIKEPFRNFADKFIATLLYNALIKNGEDISPNIDELMDKSQQLFHKTHAAIKQINSLIDKNDIDDAYSGLLNLTSVLKKETLRPCVVILDEFDNLEYLGIKNPFLSFGKVIMVQKDTMYIVSSSRDNAVKKILSEKLSLLFGNFEIVKITGFDAASAARFTDMKLSGFDIDEGLKKFLIAFTNSNAFYLDKIASRAREIALERMASYINESVIEEALLDLGMAYSSGAELKLYELAEDELDLLINKMHRSGLNYWQILGLFLDKAPVLYMQADAEYWLKRNGVGTSG